MTDQTLNIISDLTKKAMKAGADAADAVSFESSDVAVAVRKDQLETIERSESQGFGLRVFVGKRKAMVSSSDTAAETFDEMVERAINMAKHSPEDPYTGLADASLLASGDNIDVLDLYDPNEPDEAWLKEQALLTEEAAISVKGITNSEGAEAQYARGTVALATSNGFANSYQTSSASLGVSVVAGEGTAMERDYESCSARHVSDLKAPQEIGKRAAENTLRRLNPRKPASGNVPVIYDSKVSRRLIGSVVRAASGALIARGTSFLKEKMGEMVFAEGIHIINNPLIKRGLASEPYDAEGVACQKLEIIKDGRLNSWLLDIRSANQLGLTTNGTAARGLSTNPSPSASNVYMENGTQDFDDMVKNISSGLYVTETFGSGINIVTGDYSQGASGFWIENGQITTPVSELTIAGNLSDMFAKAIPANDLEFRYATNAPSLLIDGMTVAGV